MSEVVKQLLDGESVRDVVLGEWDSTKYLFEMTNVLGSNCVVGGPLNFSFYFSRKDHNRHGIRVKIAWNPNRFTGKEDGNLELHGEYKYVPTNGAKHVSKADVDVARNFFKKYKVLFAAVWEGCLDPSALYDYFRGTYSFKDVIKNLYVKDETCLAGVTDLNQLENVVRQNHLFNMND